MKKILILVSKIGPKKIKFADYLNERIGKNKVVLEKFTNLVFEINGKSLEARIGRDDINNFGLVYLRRVGGGGKDSFFSTVASLSVCLDYLKIKYFDTTFSEVGSAGDKFTSLLKLSMAGLPIPPTFFCRKDNLINQRDYIVAKFGLPMVAKGLSSHRGAKVFLLKNKKDFNMLLDPGDKSQFLFQKFIPHIEEYRILVLGGRAVVWEKKIKLDSEEFRYNIALGGKEEFLNIKDIPLKMANIAIKAAKIRQIEIAGVDLIVDKKTGKMWILEVNRGPGVTYDAKISPELSEIANFLKGQLRK